jgi:hypothetical protein
MVDTVDVDVVTSDSVTDSPSEAQTSQEASNEPNYDALASDMGWTPKDKFRGDPAKWVDAETFYEKGQHVLPIVKSKLKEETAARLKLEAELKQTKQDTIALKHHMEKASAREKAELAGEIARLKQERITAIQEGDGVRVDQVETRIEELKAAQKEQVKPEARQDAMPPPPQEYLEWKEANPWFEKDTVMTAVVNARAYEMNLGGHSLAETLKAVDAEIRERFPEKFQDKSTERPSAQRGGSVAKKAAPNSYEAMPLEDQKTCDRMVKQYGFKREDYVKNYWS